MKFKYLIYSLVLLGCLAILYFLFLGKGGEKKTASTDVANVKPVFLEAVIVSPRNFANSISVSGAVEAEERVEIRSEISGKAEQIYFSEGASVSKGQVLIKINDIELVAQLKQAETRQQLAAEGERRARLLLGKQAISQEEYDIASADFKTTSAQSDLIKAQLSKTVIRAPFGGIIGLRNISPGTYVTPQTLIATLVNTNKVKVTFSVPEKHIARLKRGSVIKFSVANDSSFFNATVYAIEPEVSATSRTLNVRAITENKSGKLIPGTYADVSLLISSQENTLTVPTQAIVPIQNGNKVFIVKNGKAQESIVKTGTRTDDDIVILSGINSGDTVLTTGILSLKSGLPVQISLRKKSSAL